MWFRASLILLLASFSALPIQAQQVQSQPFALAPRAVTSFGAAQQGGWLYVLGGAVGKPHHYDTKSQASEFWRLNLRNGAHWEFLPTLPHGLQSVALTSVGQRLVRVGGMRSLNSPGTPMDLRSSVDCAQYMPGTGEWTALPSLPEGRSSHDCATDGRVLYAIGGWRLTGNTKEAHWYESVLKLDLSQDSPTWQVVGEAPFARRALACAVMAHRLYAMGGINEVGEISKQVDVLDLKTMQWSEGPEFPEGGFGMSAVTTKHGLIASGMSGKIYKLRADGMSWECVGQHRFARFFHRLVVGDRDDAFAVSGSGKRGRLRHIERISFEAGEASKSLATASPSPRMSSLELPIPITSRNRQGVFLKDQSLYFFGGNNSTGQHDFEPENFLNEAFSINLGSLQVKRHPALPVHRQSFLTAQTGKGRRRKGWAIGGFGHDGKVARATPEIMRYDFGKDEWERTAASLPSARTQAGVALRGEDIWLFGGLDYDPRREKPDRFRHETAVLHVSTEGETPVAKTSDIKLTGPRRAFGSAMLNDHFYLVGGMRENFKLVDHCEKFDFATKQFTTIASPRRTRLNPKLIPLDGRIYLIGGSSRQNGKLKADQSVEVYDPKLNTWSILIEELPITARHIHAFAFQHQLLLVSTHHEDTPSARILFIAPGLAPLAASHSQGQRPTSRPKHGG